MGRSILRCSSGSSLSTWPLFSSYLDGEKMELVQFGPDAGFGEWNSLGFGFMNRVGRAWAEYVPKVYFSSCRI
ncbi:MAG: hypothetical protein AB1476_05440 [Candidatus Hadarchaeota archaeon]